MQRIIKNVTFVQTARAHDDDDHELSDAPQINNLNFPSMAHLTLWQRYTISVMLQQSSSISFIASSIGKNKSVVSREIRRNRSLDSDVYDPFVAQALAQKRQRSKRHYVRLTPEIVLYIDALIRADYSPEQIVGRSRRDNIPCVSVTTIYKHIWANKETNTTSKLFHHLRVGNKKGLKSFGKRTSLGVIPERTMIHERPEIVDQRGRFGDFEADTIWIANKAVVVTVNDRATGISHIRHLPNRKSDNVNQAIKEMLAPYGKRVKTITVDNGKEFYKHKELAQMVGCKVYFADPYASWQRGSNENLNKLYRQYLPRKTDYNSLTPEYIKMIENKLNNRPRKRYGYLSPLEYFSTNFA